MRRLFLLALVLLPALAHAQNTPRFGLALNSLLTLRDGLGLGVHGRAAVPINVDLSAAVDLGATGFVLEGRRSATYVVTPQIGVVINLPSYRQNVSYLVAGFGGYLPVNTDDNSKGGPTFHVAYGQVIGLRETSIFWEVNPALVVAQDNVDLALPVRLGIIF